MAPLFYYSCFGGCAVIPTVGYAGPSLSSPVFGGCAVIN